MKKNKNLFKSFNSLILLFYNRLEGIYNSRQMFLSAVAFVLGILWDILTIGRIDQWSNIIQLGLYTTFGIGLVFLEIVELGNHDVQKYFSRIRKRRILDLILGYRIEATHFLLGSLLSAFTVFFVKSASIWSSLVFILTIGAALVANELPHFRRLGVQLRLCLIVICAASYLSCLVPLIFRSIGVVPFGFALFSTMILFFVVIILIGKIFDIGRMMYEKYLPIVMITLGAFLVFYVSGWIPPVPLAVTKIGIYRDVIRSGSFYELKHNKNPWYFWQRGEQSFYARSGDKVYVFFSVFAPAGFKENLKVKWYYRDSIKGLDLRDTMEVQMRGGRDAGYRGFAYKSRYQWGEWVVSIETADQREIGRIALTIQEDSGEDQRFLQSEFY
jgi:hypothetical protein